MGIYISQNSIKYPKLLKEIGGSAPEQLYYKGDISLLDSDCLAVVGSRRMTAYGRQITEKLVSEIASRGLTIVSGFMYGIDATAHQATVDVGGRTELSSKSAKRNRCPVPVPKGGLAVLEADDLSEIVDCSSNH